MDMIIREKNGKILEIFKAMVAQMVKNLPAVQETWVRSLGREDPLERKMVTHSSNPMDRGSWLGVGHYSPWYHKELDTTERLTFIHVCWPLVSASAPAKEKSTGLGEG